MSKISPVTSPISTKTSDRTIHPVKSATDILSREFQPSAATTSSSTSWFHHLGAKFSSSKAAFNHSTNGHHSLFRRNTSGSSSSSPISTPPRSSTPVSKPSATQAFRRSSTAGLPSSSQSPEIIPLRRTLSASSREFQSESQPLSQGTESPMTPEVRPNQSPKFSPSSASSPTVSTTIITAENDDASDYSCGISNLPLTVADKKSPTCGLSPNVSPTVQQTSTQSKIQPQRKSPPLSPKESNHLHQEKKTGGLMNRLRRLSASSIASPANTSPSSKNSTSSYFSNEYPFNHTAEETRRNTMTVYNTMVNAKSTHNYQSAGSGHHASPRIILNKNTNPVSQKEYEILDELLQKFRPMPSSVASLNFQNTKSPELRELITEGSMLSPMVSHADLSSSSTVDSQKSRAPDSRCGSCNGVKDEFPIDNTIRGIDGPKSVVVKTSIARIGVKPLKTVAFDISTFVHDPPQLIPAKHPKPGCVIVNEDGKIDIRDAKRNTLTSSLLSSSTKNNSCPVVNSLRSNTIKTPILNAVESGSAVHNTISVPGVKSGMPKNSLSLSNSSSADTSVSIAKTTKPSSLPLASNKDQPNSKSSSLSSNRKTLEVSRNSSETSLTSLLDNELDSFTPSRHNSTATLLPLNPTKKATGAPSESLIPVLNEHTIADEEIDQRLARVISHNRAITTDVNLVNSASEDGHGNNRGMINDPDYIPPEDRDGDLVVDIQTTLASIYARCCHLREILSLPLTLNQIKGKTLRDLPLKTLRLINPRPTMIEILSFCDFIKIIPIKQLSFDNLTLSDEQIYMIFSALLWLNELERVSLKNMQFTTVNNTLNENIKENDISTKTDSEASSGAYNSWYYLCLFLLKNKSLKRLDISQTESKNAEMVHHYHWPLFIDALEKRGGIDQIVINGCVNPLSNDSTPELSLASEKNFHNFLYRACMPKTRRMGMANNPNITSRHLQIFYEWFNLPECKLEVIDFSNNDNMFKDAKDIELLTESISLSQESANRLRFVSFRNNGLSNDIQAEGKLDSISRLLDSLSLLPTLQLLDFSSNPKLFTNPTFFAKFSEIFSKPLTELDLIKNGPNINELSSDNGLFVQLRRLHLNDNGMRNRDLIILFETFLNSTSLFQISLLNNIEIESDTESAECTFPSKPLDSNKRYLISIILSILTLKLSKNIFNIDLFSEDFVKKNVPKFLTDIVEYYSDRNKNYLISCKNKILSQISKDRKDGGDTPSESTIEEFGAQKNSEEIAWNTMNEDFYYGSLDDYCIDFENCNADEKGFDDKSKNKEKLQLFSDMITVGKELNKFVVKILERSQKPVNETCDIIVKTIIISQELHKFAQQFLGKLSVLKDLSIDEFNSLSNELKMNLDNFKIVLDKKVLTIINDIKNNKIPQSKSFISIKSAGQYVRAAGNEAETNRHDKNLLEMDWDLINDVSENYNYYYNSKYNTANHGNTLLQPLLNTSEKLSRLPSSASLKAKRLEAEEGRMHRISSFISSDINKKDIERYRQEEMSGSENFDDILNDYTLLINFLVHANGEKLKELLLNVKDRDKFVEVLQNCFVCTQNDEEIMTDLKKLHPHISPQSSNLDTAYKLLFSLAQNYRERHKISEDDCKKFEDENAHGTSRKPMFALSTEDEESDDGATGNDTDDD